MRLFWKMTGGRPMKRGAPMFTDVVTGVVVWSWVDRLGRHWMAEGPWSMFRVPRREVVAVAKRIAGDFGTVV